MKTIELKIRPDFLARVASGGKKAEVRKDDRDFEIGDRIRFAPVGPCPARLAKAARLYAWEITDVLTSEDFPDGIRDGYCVLSIRRLRRPTVRRGSAEEAGGGAENGRQGA